MRLLLILLWAACFCLSLSQTTPGGGGGGVGGGTNLNPTEADYDGYTMIPLGPIISGTPFAEILVSVSTPGVDSIEDFINGTNTAVTMMADVFPRADWAEKNEAENGPNYTVEVEGYTMMNAQINVGGQTVVDQSWNLDGECPEGYLNLPPDITFASTHFPSGDEVEIKLQAKFQAYKVEGGVRVPVGPLMTHYARLKPTVHNKLVGWRTHVTGNGGSWTPEMDANINDTVNGLKSMYASANYDVTLVDLSVVQEPTLKSRYLHATAIATNTHGSSGGLYDSDGFSSANDRLTWVEQRTKLNELGTRGSDNEYPKTHLHFIYACEALESPTAASYGLMPHESGGAISGFTEPVGVKCRDQSNNLVSFSLHVDLVRKYLALGYPVGQAVSLANIQYNPLDSGGNFLPMQVQGDPNSTLNWVYLGHFERAMWPVYADWKVTRW